MATQSRNLVAKLEMDASGMVRGSQIGQAAAKQLQMAQLRLIAAEERLQTLRASGVARAGQLASAQAGVIAAQDRVAKATRATADATLVSGSRTSRVFDSTRASAEKMSTGIGLAAAAGGAAVVAMARKSIDAASNLNEQMSATKTLFGDAAESMVEFAQSAEAIGVSERAALEAGNAYGDLFLKIGMTEEAAAGLAQGAVQMAADFSSFKNLGMDEALDKIRAGLVGEAEPLRALGVFLTAAKVEAEGMRLGLAGANGQLSEGAKITARYSLILSEMGDAQGDAARTADSYANTQRRAAAASENLQAELGQRLLPVFTDIAYVMSEGSSALRDFAQKADEGSAAGGRIGEAIQGFGNALSNQLFPLGSVADGIRGLKGDTDEAEASALTYARATEILNDQQQHTAAEVNAATVAVEQHTEALDRALEATIAQFDSEMAYTLSLLGITDALTDYDAALKTNSDAKADNDLSATEMTRKELALSEALLQAGSAAVRQAEDHAKAAGVVLSEADKYAAFREELIRLKEQFPQLAGQIDGYLSRLKEVPAEVSTTAKADTAPATGALSLLSTVLTETDSRVVTPTVLADTSQAITGLRAVDHLLDSLSGRSVSTAVTTTRTTRELFLPGGLGQAAGGLVGRAAGGLIIGPGTGTSDSILGMDARGVPTSLVSNGEFVQREAAVSKYGLGFMHAVNSLQLSQAAARESMGALTAAQRLPFGTVVGGRAAGGLVTATGGLFDPLAAFERTGAGR
jgi:hypothetical protein